MAERAQATSATGADVHHPAPHRKASRQLELDGLRGFFLVWMTLTHLPTGISGHASQPFGFVSAAEGFIFLSAVLSGRTFGRKLKEGGMSAVWRPLWARAGRLYAYHLFMLAVSFTVVAFVAVNTDQPSLTGLLGFYLAHPISGVISSLFLIYRPPLLDILPIYIWFLLWTPLALWAGKRWGWSVVLIPSLLIWTGAQFGLRSAAYAAFVHVTGFDIPLGDLGAFDLYGWQLLWTAGLWIGSERRDVQRIQARRRLEIAGPLVIAVCFLILRYTASWDVINAPPWEPLIDKWHLGPVRLLDFSSWAILFAAMRTRTVNWLGRGPLVTFGQASLEVFCAQLLLCFAALAAVNTGAHDPGWQQACIVVLSLSILYGVAKLFAKERTSGTPRRED